MKVKLLLRTVSEANRREHWSTRSARVADHRGIVRLTLMPAHRTPPAVVTLTRIAPRELDDDNLRGALKAVRDGVADAMGVDDRDPRIRWEYAQRRGKVREYSVEIHIQEGVSNG